jgi:perosamine synthetase
MNIKKLFNYLPLYPHYKMNIFSGTNSISEIKNTIKSLILNNIVHGEKIKEYENDIGNRINSNHIYSFASGRMGFYTILKSINIEKDDEVILPSFTCVVVPNAILYSGAKPIYCDIKNDDFNIDISKLEELITTKTKVLYAQHTFGQMCDIKAIQQIAQKYNLIVIEDATLALGARLSNEYAGTIGDFGYFSTDRSKIINTGLGGIVSVNNKKYLENFNEIYQRIPYLDKQMTKKIARTFILNIITLNPHFYWFGKFLNVVLSELKLMSYFLDESFIKKENILNYPYPARLSNIFAEIGVSQIQSLKSNLENRKKISKYYNNILHIYTNEYIEDNKNIFLRYSFLVRNRDYWEKKFSSRIDLSIWFKTIASGRNNDFYKINYIVGTNKNSENVCECIFNLPTHNQINPKKLEKLLYELKSSGDIITKEHIL